MRSITKTIVIAASTIALCFGLTACGGGQSTSSDNSSSNNSAASSEKTAPTTQEESKAVDFYMFKGEMPEGYGLTGPNGNSSPLNIVEFRNIENPDKIIDVEIDEGTAQEQFDKAAAKDKYTAGDDVKLDKYTWKTLNFTWNKQPSVVLYTDIADGLYAEVTLYETTLDDAAVKAFLEGVEFATDYDAAHKAGMDTTVEKFATDNNLTLWEAK
ncbi:hypothetical protein [uncultured Ellagibacter sp.]|uniref:hypothetical protein n=1 Tax=uncultured Ellagibacter sp. TaxID=2137580 RepID=UPI002612F60C|nr:hypothetical protein [uncultured Ellagibacter sp.]